ncbi:MAG: sugar ABC transporter permease [Tessaracoccus sp.]|uniref:carbohydrate ABC transporter permease n=1 Tax=Tessaracoccus sp. TaxID=1971211 RepID=UPI001ECDDA0D|nr:sugar ABC transporter permease [Tessaracoccus sp.]MBK7819960.1 sugar ABC transporter permease [Tessaracoccus sp.]
MRRTRPRNGLQRSQGRWGWIFALPAVVGFLVFTLSPMIASGVIGTTSWTIGQSPQFVGLGNYTAIAQDSLFWKSLSVTGYYAILAVPGGLIVAFLTASLLNKAKRGRSTFRTIYYLPVLVPPVASAVLWLWLFNPDSGLLNEVLKLFGLPPSLWVYGEETAIPSVALMAIWGFGNMTLVFLAGLQGVSRELYEAAECDGASPLRRMWHITLPSISPVILFNLITGMIAAVQIFDAAYVMTQGGPNNATLVYVFYLYSKAFGEGQLGYASALAWILFLIILVVTVLLFRTSRQWVFYEGGKR